MPELPEVETMARDLAPLVEGAESIKAAAAVEAQLVED
jgi:formamidopyrimidine-DNA glycosylase